MLADEGINQTTLKEMVEKVIEEKVEKAIYTYLCQSNTEKLIYKKLEDEISSCMRMEIRNKINHCFSNINVQINLNNEKE